MREAPERIWAAEFSCGSTSWTTNPRIAKYRKHMEYILMDAHRAEVEAAVKRALEGAANCLLMFSEPGVALDYSLKDEIEAIRSLASDPAQFIDGEK